MRAVLDACVLYPTATRILLLDAARGGHFRPVWSARILEEWARAMARDGAEAERHTRGVIAALEAEWQASVTPAPHDAGLPDVNDDHVLGACLAGGAGFLVTRNIRDFPLRTLARHGVSRSDPDSFLLSFAREDPAIGRCAAGMPAAAGWSGDLRSFLRRAGLPRLGKFLAG